MTSPLICPDNARRALVRASPLNAIDHVEVLDNQAPPGSPPQQTLLVHCFKDVTGTGLTGLNVRIDGGVRVRAIRVVWAFPAQDVPTGLLNTAERNFVLALPDAPRVLLVRVRERGDLSTYRLRLVLAQQSDLPPAGFDPQLSAMDFSFKVECPSEFDCLVAQHCPPEPELAPPLDYLAKDYASFRRLLLDRLAVVMPDWTERSPADVGIALVELLAYVGDQLSYYQDAVAQEAYLGTARRRVSVRRHARLVDYTIGEGSNARAWICLETGPGAEGAVLPRGAVVLSGPTGATPAVAPLNLGAALRAGAVVFETRHDVTLAAARNAIEFYTWGDPGCCLAEGATQASLAGGAAELGLLVGDVLVFEEVRGDTGLAADADPAKRHAVRLDAEPVEVTDPVTGRTVLEVRWHAEDALPFPLDLAQQGGLGASVARGNVVLADSGRTIVDEALVPPIVPDEGRYRPVLASRGLTHAVPYDNDAARALPAAATSTVDPRLAAPVVELAGEGEPWHPARDLLGSDRFAGEFVVETENDGQAFVRFGDGVVGRAPVPGAVFTATYRVGGGAVTNVGAGVLNQVVTALDDIVRVRNPLPAAGGTDPESIDQVRLAAPQAFRVQQRAVTEADYAEVAGRHPEVQKAAATRRWTGSWYTVFVTVDRRGGREVDEAFEAELRQFLERFRLAGYDLEIDAPRFVPLHVALGVCVADGYLRSAVNGALLDVFSNRDLPDGRRGFFHPDAMTFGQPVYLSQVVAAAMAVPGVRWIDRDTGGRRGARFQRWGQPEHGELAAGVIELGRLEIARLDNDPNTPENGKLEFFLRGGL